MRCAICDKPTLVGCIHYAQIIVHRSNDYKYPVGYVLRSNFTSMADADNWHDDFMEENGEPDIDVTFSWQ